METTCLADVQIEMNRLCHDAALLFICFVRQVTRVSHSCQSKWSIRAHAVSVICTTIAPSPRKTIALCHSFRSFGQIPGRTFCAQIIASDAVYSGMCVGLLMWIMTFLPSYRGRNCIHRASVVIYLEKITEYRTDVIGKSIAFSCDFCTYTANDRARENCASEHWNFSGWFVAADQFRTDEREKNDWF